MSNGIKKIFENAVWWSGVVMVGLILGLSLQVVKAWTEPTEAPPGGNVGAPINTGILGQFKQGALQVLGFTLYNDADPDRDGIIQDINNVTGKVLTAKDANGQATWAAGGGGYSYTVFGTTTCDSQYRTAYTGEAIAVRTVSGTTPSDIICSAKTIPDSSEEGSWLNGIYGNRMRVSCAVCVK